MRKILTRARRVSHISQVAMDPATLVILSDADMISPVFRGVQELCANAGSSLGRASWTAHRQRIEVVVDDTPVSFHAADPTGVSTLLGNRTRIVIVISTLSYPAWISLVFRALLVADVVQVVYVEPRSYREDPAPTSWSWFDLSGQSTEPGPIPGLATLGPVADKNRVLVMFLGFEGARARHVVGAIDPRPPNFVPVIGSPAFRPEYVNYAIACNRSLLEEEQAFRDLRLATAADPFASLELLAELSRSFGNAHLNVGLTGTRCHALGALLYVVLRPGRATLMYDHPVERPDRVAGHEDMHCFTLKESGSYLFHVD